MDSLRPSGSVPSGDGDGGAAKRTPYRPSFLPDGRKAYNPSRTMLDIYDEWAAFEERVRASEPDCQWPDLRARELWRQEEEKKERWGEWQERVWRPRMRSLAAERDSNRLDMTREELERLIEHFAGANDPVAQSILAKALAALPK